MSLAAATDVASESVKRITVVGEQKQIEDMLVDLKRASAVFLVPNILTPLYIDPAIVEYDADQQIYRLIEGEEKNFPEGLVLESVRKDPKQFSTVLGRAITVNNMLRADIPITVLYVNSYRKKAENADEYVNDAQVKALQAAYPELLDFIQITQAQYDAHKAQICAATYAYYDQSGILNQVGIDASQANTVSPAPAEWGVRNGDALIAKIDKLNLFLEALGLFTLTEMLQGKVAKAPEVAEAAAVASPS